MTRKLDRLASQLIESGCTNTSALRSLGVFSCAWSTSINNGIAMILVGPGHYMKKFSREDHGLLALFMAEHHDGEKLQQPTTQENIRLFRRTTAFELMRLQDNLSNTPAEAINSIRASLNIF